MFIPNVAQQQNALYRGEVDVVLGSWAYPDGFAAVLLGAQQASAAALALAFVLLAGRFLAGVRG